jgi:hypothetical protein
VEAFATPRGEKRPHQREQAQHHRYVRHSARFLIAYLIASTLLIKLGHVHRPLAARDERRAG